MDFELTVLDTPAEQLERVAEEEKPFTIPASPLPPAPYCQPITLLVKRCFHTLQSVKPPIRPQSPRKKRSRPCSMSIELFRGKRHCAGYGISSFGTARYCAV